ncbi:MAG: Spy/CpxP family protein refolding chaperone, partial [Solimonas sp.]
SAEAAADGSDTPPPPPPPGDGGPQNGPGGNHGGPHFGGPDGGGFDGGFPGGPGGERGGGLLRDLHGLDLSDAQEDAIDDVFAKHHKEQRELFKRERDLHRAYRELDPLAKDYVGQSGKLADQAASLTRDSIKLRAKVDSEVLATLTPEQTEKLKAELADKKAKHDDRRGPSEHGPRRPQPEQPKQ